MIKDILVTLFSIAIALIVFGYLIGLGFSLAQ